MNPDESLRLLHVTAPAPVGGLESVVLALTTGLAGRGHRVGLVCVVEPGSPVPALAERAGARGVEVDLLRVPRRGYVSEYRALRGRMAEMRTQVVHTHGYRPDIVGGEAARRAGVPHVTTAHGFIGGSHRGRFYEWLQLRATRRAQAAVAVARPIADLFRSVGVPEGRIVTLPNALTPAEPLPADEARALLGCDPQVPLIGWVGRFTPEKGADVMLEALGRMRHRAWNAVLIGAGRERGELEARAVALGIERRVRFPGVIPEAGRLARAFDAWVMSSRTEGTPIALLEAMAAGCPIVTTAVGGIPDVISAAEGWLVPPDDPDALAAAVVEALTAADAGGRGLAAAARVRRELAPGPWLDRHERLYRSLLIAPGREARPE